MHYNVARKYNKYDNNITIRWDYYCLLPHCHGVVVFEQLLKTFTSKVKLQVRSICEILFLINSLDPSGGWLRWALVSPDGVVPRRIVCVSASVNLPLHHKVQKFSSGTGSPVWSRKKGRKTVVVIT